MIGDDERGDMDIVVGSCIAKVAEETLLVRIYLFKYKEYIYNEYKKMCLSYSDEESTSGIIPK